MAEILPRAAVLIDVENMFTSFRRDTDYSALPGSRRRQWPEESFNRSLEKSRRAAREFFGTAVDYFDANKLAPFVVSRLHDWLEQRFDVEENHRRSYGYLHDEGVSRTWSAFVRSHDWNHTIVDKADDRADRALLSDVALLAHSPDLRTIVVASSDRKLVIKKAVEWSVAGGKELVLVLGPVKPKDFESLASDVSLRGFSQIHRLNAIYRDQVRQAKLGAGAVATTNDLEAQEVVFAAGQLDVRRVREQARRELKLPERPRLSQNQRARQSEYDQLVAQWLDEGLGTFLDRVARKFRDAQTEHFARTAEYLFSAVEMSKSPLAYDAATGIADLIATRNSMSAHVAAVATFPVPRHRADSSLSQRHRAEPDDTRRR